MPTSPVMDIGEEGMSEEGRRIGREMSGDLHGSPLTKKDLSA